MERKPNENWIETASESLLIDGEERSNSNHSFKRNKKVVSYLQFGLILCACVVFMLYICDNPSYAQSWKIIVSAACLVIFTAIGVIAMPKIVLTLTERTDYSHLNNDRMLNRFYIVMLIALGIRIIATFIGILIYKMNNLQFEGSLYDLWMTSWMKGDTDAQHYLTIASEGYVNEGDNRLLIVFFPMLPMLIRLLNYIFADGFVSAQIINTFASCLACGFLYKIFCGIMSERKAFISALVFLLLPGSIFLNSPMSEPLFILFTALCFYCLQKDKFLLAALFAACAGFTRSVGILLVVPIAIEGISFIVNAYKNNESAWKKSIGVFAAILISTLGTLAYLGINYKVSGDPFIFSVYQKLNWSQSIGLFFDTPRYMLDFLFDSISKGDVSMVVSLWGPALVTIFGSMLIYIPSIKRMPASYTAYFLAYFIITVGCTWLLSAVRYLALAFPISATIGMQCKSKWKTALILSILAVLYVSYMYLYMIRWLVY